MNLHSRQFGEHGGEAPALRLIGAGALLLFGGTALAVFAPQGFAAETASTGPGQSPTTIGKAPDILELSTGARLSGRILNPQFTLQTSYGEVSLQTPYLMQIRALENEHDLQAVLTMNGNHLIGFIEDPIVRIQRPDETCVEVLKAQIAKVVFGSRSLPAPVNADALWIQLRTGDTMSGRFLAQPIQIVESGTNSGLNLNEVSSGFFGTNSEPELTVLLRDGRARQCRLNSPYVEFQLDAGPKVKLYTGSIAWVGSAPNPNTATESSVTSSPDPSVTNLAGFVWIAPGRFRMGSPTEESGRDPDEGPQTQVTIPRGFWMSVHEVTQAEFQRVMGTNPSSATGDSTRPVERVTWFEAMDYCKKLSDEADQAARVPEGYVYRLPTEAEWEYACRAGTDTRFSFGEDKNATQLVDYAWFTRNSDSTTHPVGTRKSNPWGLYDMHGNVWEWCLDRWEDGLPGGAVTNRIARASGSLRAARGGSWLYEPKACRSANRDDYSPWNRCSDIGFRVILGPMQ